MEPFETRCERLELKYLIHEPTAARVRAAIHPYCRPDAHSAASGARGYTIRSLYLDTPDLAFHRAKERGDPERFKLRIRSYEAGEKRFLELKRRSSDVIEKTRVCVRSDRLRDAAHGLEKLERESAPARRFLDDYARRVMSTCAGPTLLVRYQREAYTSEVDRYARVTFDRNLQFQRVAGWTLDGERGWTDLDSHLAAEAPRPLVVLEIKCEVVVPWWVCDVIRRNDLKRASVSKYSLGIYLSQRLDGASMGQERARGVLR